MLAGELISHIIPTLHGDERVEHALAKYADFKQNDLPLVNDDVFLGVVSEDDLIEIRDRDVMLKDADIPMLHYYVYENVHIYEAMATLTQSGRGILPVLAAGGEYRGCITLATLTEHTAELFAVMEPGAVLVLEISNRDNSLAHMAALVEAEGAQVLSSYVSTFNDSTKMHVTLKINRTDVTGIINAFERHKYVVTHYFNAAEAGMSNADRYDSFMHYLDI